MEYKYDIFSEKDAPLTINELLKTDFEISPSLDLQYQFQELCSQYVNSFTCGNYIESNTIIMHIYTLLDKSKKQINFSSIIEVMVQTHFFDALLDIIQNRHNDFLANVIELIALGTYLSNEFAETISHSNILLHFLSVFYESDGFYLNKHQEYNLFISIRNLIDFWPNKNYHFFFNEFPFMDILIKMKEIDHEITGYKVFSGFLYSFISSGKELDLYYPWFISISESILTRSSFRYVLCYIDHMIVSSPCIIPLIFTSFLDNIAEIYMKYNEDCYNDIQYYYMFLTDLIHYFDNNSDDLEIKIFKIKNAIPMDEMNNIHTVLKSDDNKLNLVGLKFVSVIIKKDLFNQLFEANQAEVVDNIAALLEDDSNFKVIVKAFEVLLIILKFNYQQYSSLCYEIPATIYSSLLQSGIPQYQLLALEFMRFVLQRKHGFQSELESSTAKSFAFNIIENCDESDLYETLMEIIEGNPSDVRPDVFENAQLIKKLIEFYTDSPND